LYLEKGPYSVIALPLQLVGGNLAACMLVVMMMVRIEKIKLSSVGVVVRPCVRNSYLSKSTTGGATKKAAATQQGRQRWLNDEGSGGATTNAEPAAARQRMQNWRRRNGEGSGSAMTKAEPAAQQERERWHDDEGRGGAMTKAEPAAQQ
jgi:hypothetical protein